MAEEELELDIEAPKKSKKGIIIAVVAVFILLNAAIAWYFLGGSNKESSGNSEETADTTKLPLHYQTLVPEFVVNFGPGSRVRYLQVELQVATRDIAALDTVGVYKPVIRNDILVLLSGLSFEELSTNAGKIALQKKLLNTINKVIVAASNHAPAEEHAAPTEGGNEAKHDAPTEGDHESKPDTGTTADENIAGPIENVYFTSFIMQ
jgi:flagellar FliL protein